MPNPVFKINLLISCLCIYDLDGPVRNVFECADPLREQVQEGVGPGKIETFLGPEMATSDASAIWAQKSLDERSP